MDWQKLKTNIKAVFKPTPYQRLGGAKLLADLVDDFYQIMRTDPFARDCWATHQAKDVAISADKLKLFLSGWLGGPQLYFEKYGHPRLRMRHFPFSIGAAESEQWLYCMQQALKNSRISPSQQQELLQAFQNLTQLIKNRE